jgi:hypothetical protein
VDLATKIKRHLRDKYQITISLADPMLLDKMTELREMDDPLLQGMIRYLMAMAGDDWVAKYEGNVPDPTPNVKDSKGLKKLFEVYRGNALRDPEKEELGDPESRKKKAEQALYRGNPPGEKPEEKADDGEEKPKERKIVRYYRGAPIYE